MEMYGNTRTPFASVVTADLNTQPQHRPPTAAAAAIGVLGHGHYPNFHHYNVPAGHGHGHGVLALSHGHGHGHVLVSPALAHMYAANATTVDGSGDHRPVEMAEELLRRRASGERRNSGSLRRNSGVGTGSELTQGAPGKKQQRFEILRKLGSGTYGRVSLATDHKAGEEVAVKVIRKSAIENTADLIRIRREIRIMSALKHPNIIEIKEVFENDEKIILVMEYASGGELYDFVGKHGPLPEDEVRRLFRQVVSAVYYCHKHGVAHRDLKLENILLDKDMGAKIADFGLSNYFTEYSKLRTFCGSPLYASPEIINGTPYRGPEVDCWSLGVLLYTLAYSSMPFDGRDFNRMSRQIKRGAYYEPDPPSSASMLIRSMLRVCPDRRAAISDIAAHWWLNFDENGLAIADMPENQVIDSTPLYIRRETMMIQSFGEEDEMFAEFTHLSDATRKKIEEYRRRRREAEWYLTECQTPLKKQSKKRSSSIVNEQQKRQSSQAVMAGQKRSREASAAASGADVASRKDSNAEVQKKPAQQQQQPEQQQQQSASRQYTAAEIAAGEAGGVPDDELLDNLTDPLNRLRALETRLNKQYQKEKVGRVGDVDMQLPEGVCDAKPPEEGAAQRPTSLPLTERPPPAPSSAASTPRKQKPASLKMSVDDLVQEKRALDEAVDNARAASLVSVVQEEANRMVNQLLEEAMKGTVAAELIESIRASEVYRAETFVKEILESVLAAQQAKSAAIPSTPTARASRSKAKQASLTRIPTSGSSSSTTPLPDVIGHDGDKTTNAVGVTPPPDIVAAVAEVTPQSIPTPQTPPVAAPVSLAPMKLIYETVPEDAELQLPAAVDGEISGEPPSTPGSSEQEEDVCSTDFEDLEIEEEEEATRERRGDDSPLSGTGSFASTHSQIGELPEIRTFAPAEGEEGKETAGATEEDNPFLRGLSKRLSRGKYERSKYVLGRGISIEESPRSSRRILAAEKRAATKQAGQGSLEEEAEHVAQNETDEQVADGAKSPRRRYSDGDKNHLDPSARREEWLQKSDSELGSSHEDIDSPQPNPDTRFHYEELENKVAPVVAKSKEKGKGEKEKRKNSKVLDTPTVAAEAPVPPSSSPPLPPAEPTQDSNLKETAISDVLGDSQRRRAERAKLKKGFRTASMEIPTPSPVEPESPKPVDKKPIATPKGNHDKKEQVILEPQQSLQSTPNCPPADSTKLPPPGPASVANHKEQKDLETEVKKAPQAPAENAEQEVSATTEGQPPARKKEVKKSKRRTAAAAVTKSVKAAPENGGLEGGNEKASGEEKKANQDDQEKLNQNEPEKPNCENSNGEPAPGAPAPTDTLSPTGDTTAPADPPAPASAPSAEKRRHSFRTAMSSSLSSSQEGDKNLPKSTIAVDHYTSGIGGGVPRSAKYHQSPSGVLTASAVPDPLWLQYAREETQRHQPQSSLYHHGYGAGDYKSSVGHGYNRVDDDYLSTRTSHLPDSSPYRVGSSYATRDLSPPRTGVGAAFRSHVDPSDSAALGYASPYGHQTSIGAAPTSRGRKTAPLYRQKSTDELGIHHLDDPLSSGPISKRYTVPTNAATAAYAPAYSRRTTGSGDYYKTLYDDNVVYRRSQFDAQPEPEDVWKPNSDKDSSNNGNQFRVFQPKGLMKRRSRSLDKSEARKLLGDGDDDQVDSPQSYVNYQDTGSHHYQRGGGGSGRYESSITTGANVGARLPPADANSKSQLKGILKKQATFDSTPSTGNTYSYGRYGEPERKNSDGEASRAINFIERIRRHLSNEKSPEPPDFITSSSTLRSRNDYMGSSDTSALDYGSSAMYTGDGPEGKQKKRFQQLGRRRTAEIRYGGSDGSGYGDDYHYTSAAAPRRAVSPPEKMKGFFGGSTTKSGQTLVGGTGGQYHYSATTSPYSPLPPTPTSTNTTRDVAAINSNYTPGYRKPYQTTGSAYRPTSYGTSGRYWHEDSSLY